MHMSRQSWSEEDGVAVPGMSPPNRSFPSRNCPQGTSDASAHSADCAFCTSSCSCWLAFWMYKQALSMFLVRRALVFATLAPSHTTPPCGIQSPKNINMFFVVHSSSGASSQPSCILGRNGQLAHSALPALTALQVWHVLPARHGLQLEIV